MGHARALLALPQEKQPEVARTVTSKGLSVRQTEALVRQLQAHKNKVPTTKKLDPDIRHLQDSLSEKLGTSVGVA